MNHKPIGTAPINNQVATIRKYKEYYTVEVNGDMKHSSESALAANWCIGE